MDTVGPSALIVIILYFLGRWSLATVDYAAAHPGKGRPERSWQVTWWIAIVISVLSAASVHVWLLSGETPSWRVFVFNGIIFSGFLIGFIVTGEIDFKARLGLTPTDD